MKYCVSVNQTKRRKTREVMVGSVGIGGDNPIRIQSMTTSNTRDVQATFEQIVRLSDAGCEIARVTVQGNKEAEACEKIMNLLVQKRYSIPVVADIHFYPPAAMKVIDFVDKVRVNPGNFVDKRASFKIMEYDDATYADELARIEKKFTPLVLKCRSLKKSMRIGTNHGSLSDRIMNRYGDTPKGMVESALEFARVCRKHDFHDFLFSMKASNPLVMIQAYRLLTAEMYRLGWDYPLHLGVTEAGEGEDGRIKSALGIGALLLDGIGDTIRVSLTEDPWHEIDPCKKLLSFSEEYQNQGVDSFDESTRLIEEISRRSVDYPKTISMHREGTVYLPIGKEGSGKEELFQNVGLERELNQWKLKRDSADGLLLKEVISDQKIVKNLAEIKELGISLISSEPSPLSMLIAPSEQLLLVGQKQSEVKRFQIPIGSTVEPENILIVSSEKDFEAIKALNPPLLFLKPEKNRLHFARKFFDWLKKSHRKIPVILHFSYEGTPEDVVIQAAAECGSLLSDGLGEGICLEAKQMDINSLRNLSFGILQAARMRSVKTEFISCPSCGRTLFDLQEVTRRIKKRTEHLPGVKIAIMGCIVNGPGEMADADFGYVGSRPGKIDLYVGKEKIEQNIDFADADDRLIELIKSHGRWVEPKLLFN